MSDASLRVLLVEDDEDDFVIVRDLIERIPACEISLDWAISVADGLAAARQTQYDAFLVDHLLGDGTGVSLVEQLRAFQPFAPIVMLTGVDNRDVDVAAMAVGVAEFVVKSQLTESLLERCIRYARDRNRVEQALWDSEAKFRDFAESTSDWLWETDASHCFTYISDSVTGPSVAARESILGKSRMQIVAPLIDADEAALTQHEAVLAKHEAFRNFEYPTYDAQRDEVRWARVSGKPVFAASGEFLGYRGTATDISNQRQTDRLLHRLGRILDQSTSEIYIFDPESLLIEDVNQRSVANTRYRREELIGAPIDLVQRHCDRASLAENYRRLITAEEESVALETVHTRRDESEYPVELRLQLTEGGGRRENCRDRARCLCKEGRRGAAVAGAEDGSRRAARRRYRARF